MTIQLTPTTNAATWDQFVHSHRGTAFHPWRWLSLQADVLGANLHRLMVTHNGRDIGIVPLLLHRRHGLWFPTSTPFPYVGPLVPEVHLAETLRALVAWSRRHGIIANQLDFGPGHLPPEDMLTGLDCRFDVDSTFVIDVSGGMAMFWSNVAKDIPRAFRASQKRGVIVEDATDQDLALHLSPLLQEAYAGNDAVCPYPPDTGVKVWQQLAGHPEVFMRVARVNGDFGGLMIAVGSGDTLCTWVAAGVRAHRNEQTNTALHVDIAQQAVTHGYRNIDLVGRVNDQVARFKQSFGGVAQPWMRAIQTNSRIYSKLRAVKERAASRT